LPPVNTSSAPAEPVRGALRWLLAVAYAVAGTAHLTSPGGFVAITPGWVPYPGAVVLLTGLCEIAGAGALLTRRLRRAAGIALAAYAVAVFPANIKHAVDGIAIGGTALGWGYHAPRLALQPVLVWLALWVGEVTDWPFRRAPMA
jgi:uncharacterized membrane protein